MMQHAACIYDTMAARMRGPGPRRAARGEDAACVDARQVLQQRGSERGARARLRALAQLVY